MSLHETIIEWETESRAVIFPCGVMFLPHSIKGDGVECYVAFKSTCGKFMLEPAFDTGWQNGDTRVSLISDKAAISNINMRQADEWLREQNQDPENYWDPRTRTVRDFPE